MNVATFLAGKGPKMKNRERLAGMLARGETVVSRTTPIAVGAEDDRFVAHPYGTYDAIEPLRASSKAAAKKLYLERSIIQAADKLSPPGGIVRRFGPIELALGTVISAGPCGYKTSWITADQLELFHLDPSDVWERALKNSRGLFIPYYAYPYMEMPTAYFPVNNFEFWAFDVFPSLGWNAKALPFIMDWGNGLPTLTPRLGKFHVAISNDHFTVYPEGIYVPDNERPLFQYDMASNGLVHVRRRSR